MKSPIRSAMLSIMALALLTACTADMKNENGRLTVESQAPFIVPFGLLLASTHTAIQAECNDIKRRTTDSGPGQGHALAPDYQKVTEWTTAIKTFFGLLPINEYKWVGECDYEGETAKGN